MDPSPWGGLRAGTEAKIKLFSEYGHVAYQIKADDVCSNMVAKFCPQTHLDPGAGVKTSNHIFFVKVAMLFIELKGIEHRAQLSKYAVITHTNDPWGEVKRSFFTFVKVAMLLIKFKWKLLGNILNLHKPLTSGVGLKRSDVEIV